MPETEAIIELFDRPRHARQISSGTTICLGIAISFAALWNLQVRAVVQTPDYAYLAIGLLVLGGGCAWWFLPLRPPRLMLRADYEGISLPKDYPVIESSIYETIPWSRISHIRSIELGEGYGLEIGASLTAKALAALKEKYGAQYQGSGHTVKRLVPVVGFRGEAERIAIALQHLTRSHAVPATGMSNKGAQPSPAGRRGGPDAGSVSS